MKLIVAVDENWGIGYKNQLLVRIPSDQRFFRETTTGNVVVMGRKTLESFPGGKPLKDRVNIVLTKENRESVYGEVIVHSVEEALEEIKKYSEEIFIIGGETIYRQFLPYCNEAYVTKIEYKYEADAHFPNLDEDAEWKMVEESEEQTYFDIPYTFTKYRRVK
ncbi:MAG: dihydrofolate reductase [Lachnospiraceae bacterium]|nr:dihydrofolate reductase [Lachnospiraceae bacterium]